MKIPLAALLDGVFSAMPIGKNCLTAMARIFMAFQPFLAAAGE
jgi:hypothetical protein